MNDILAYPDMENYLRVFYSEYLLDMYPKEAYHLPLARMEHVKLTIEGDDTVLFEKDFEPSSGTVV